MNFTYAILIFSMVSMLSGCEDKIIYHDIQTNIDNNHVKIGDRPFSGRNIQRICILVSGADLKEYLDSDKFVPYGHVAIIEFRSGSNNIRYLREGTLLHSFPLSSGTGFCTTDAEKLLINKIGKNWILEMENI